MTALKFPAIAGCRERRVWVAPPDAQALFCRRRRHQPRRPPLAKIRPGRPAPAMGPGTPTDVTGVKVVAGPVAFSIPMPKVWRMALAPLKESA